ncbi:ABC transporter permease [Niallia circulans]|nr:ABC transporter permease [Niallia circulans]
MIIGGYILFHLIKLELRKHKLGWFIKGAIIANIVILGLLCMITFEQIMEGEESFQSFADYSMVAGTMVRGVFVVFASVLISKVIIDEFKNRTALVLFSYPIDRKKIMSAKIVLIFIMTFVTLIISNLFVILSFLGLNQVFHLTIEMNVTINQFRSELLNILVFNVATAGASLVPLYFGMRNYSTPATIGSSLLIVMIMCSSIGTDFSLANIIYIPITLTIVAIGIVNMTIRKMDSIDLQ